MEHPWWDHPQSSKEAVFFTEHHSSMLSSSYFGKHYEHNSDNVVVNDDDDEEDAANTDCEENCNCIVESSFVFLIGLVLESSHVEAPQEKRFSSKIHKRKRRLHLETCTLSVLESAPYRGLSDLLSC